MCGYLCDYQSLKMTPLLLWVMETQQLNDAVPFLFIRADPKRVFKHWITIFETATDYHFLGIDFLLDVFFLMNEIKAFSGLRLNLVMNDL